MITVHHAVYGLNNDISFCSPVAFECQEIGSSSKENLGIEPHHSHLTTQSSVFSLCSREANNISYNQDTRADKTAPRTPRAPGPQAGARGRRGPRPGGQLGVDPRRPRPHRLLPIWPRPPCGRPMRSQPGAGQSPAGSSPTWPRPGGHAGWTRRGPQKPRLGSVPSESGGS